MLKNGQKHQHLTSGFPSVRLRGGATLAGSADLKGSAGMLPSRHPNCAQAGDNAMDNDLKLEN